MIDTPGEYLERTYMRGALMVSAADADTIVLVQDATENGTMFPPGYSSSFAKPCIGVVTKSDKATEKQLEDAQKYLKIADFEETVDSLDNILFTAVMRLLDTDTGGPVEQDQTDVSNVRFLLESLRKCIRQ